MKTITTIIKNRTLFISLILTILMTSSLGFAATYNNKVSKSYKFYLSRYSTDPWLVVKISNENSQTEDSQYLELHVDSYTKKLKVDTIQDSEILAVYLGNKRGKYVSAKLIQKVKSGDRTPSIGVSWKLYKYGLSRELKDKLGYDDFKRVKNSKKPDFLIAYETNGQVIDVIDNYIDLKFVGISSSFLTNDIIRGVELRDTVRTEISEVSGLADDNGKMLTELFSGANGNTSLIGQSQSLGSLISGSMVDERGMWIGGPIVVDFGRIEDNMEDIFYENPEARTTSPKDYSASSDYSGPMYGDPWLMDNEGEDNSESSETTIRTKEREVGDGTGPNFIYTPPEEKGVVDWFRVMIGRGYMEIRDGIGAPKGELMYMGKYTTGGTRSNCFVIYGDECVVSPREFMNPASSDANDPQMMEHLGGTRDPRVGDPKDGNAGTNLVKYLLPGYVGPDSYSSDRKVQVNIIRGDIDPINNLF